MEIPNKQKLASGEQGSMSIGGTGADWLLLVATAAIAWYGLTWREITGARSWVHLLIGGVALVFCLRTLMVSILGVT